MARFTLSDIAKIAAILLSAIVMLVANGLQGTLVPVRAEMEGFSTLMLGVLGTAYFAGFGLGCVCIPHILRRAGYVRAFAILTAFTAAAIAAHPLSFDPVFWTGLRAVVGFAAAGMFAIIESWLNGQAHNAVRGRVFTTYAATTTLALAAGNGLFAIGDPRGQDMFSWAVMLTLACLIPLCMTVQPEPARPSRMRIRIGRLYRLSPAGFMGAVVVGLGGGAFWSLAMKYGADRGLDQGGIAFFMTAAIMGGALAHWPLGRASDFTDRRIVIMFAAGVAATASAGLASAHLFGEWARWAMFAAAFLYGASAFPIGSLANAHLNDRAHANDVSETASGILLVYGCAAAIGPFAGALMMQTAGPSGLFLYTATVQFAYLMFVLVRMLQRGPAEHETPASAVALPGSSLADDAVSRSGP